MVLLVGLIRGVVAIIVMMVANMEGMIVVEMVAENRNDRGHRDRSY